jgi:hypothetical protein
MLDLVVQIGPCRIGSVGYRLLRVHGGSDQPAIVEAIKRAGGELDGTGEFWWMEARNLRSFVDDLRRIPDLFSPRLPQVGPRNYWDPLPENYSPISKF